MLRGWGSHHFQWTVSFAKTKMGNFGEKPFVWKFFFGGDASKKRMKTSRLEVMGSPTSTVSNSTNSTSTHFQNPPMKFNLYNFAYKNPTCTNSTYTILHQSPLLVRTQLIRIVIKFPHLYYHYLTSKSPHLYDFN